MLKNYFKEQIDEVSAITEDIYDRIEFKRVWSGKMMKVGDKVLYAFVYPKGETEKKIMSLLESELDDMNRVFDFIEHEKETIPVLKYK